MARAPGERERGEGSLRGRGLCSPREELSGGRGPQESLPWEETRSFVEGGWDMPLSGCKFQVCELHESELFWRRQKVGRRRRERVVGLGKGGSQVPLERSYAVKGVWRGL